MTPIEGTLQTEYFKWRFGIQVSRNYAVRIATEPPATFACIAQERGDGRIQISSGETILTEARPSHEKHSWGTGSLRYSFTLPDGQELQAQTQYSSLWQNMTFLLNGEELTAKVSREPWDWHYEFSEFSFFVPTNPLEDTARFSVSDPALLLPCVISFYLSWLRLAKLGTA